MSNRIMHMSFASACLAAWILLLVQKDEYQTPLHEGHLGIQIAMFLVALVFGHHLARILIDE